VKTYPLLGFWFVILAIRTATEGRQGTPLLEHCRKQALCGRSGGAAAALYLGEINDGQREAWCHQIEAFDEASGRHRQLALFPAEQAVRGSPPATP
jgi:hypothetical protein